MNSKTEISVLLPTRGRTKSLQTSLMTLVQCADDPKSLQILLAFDDDDTESFEWFQQHTAPELDSAGVEYQALGFKRLGYIRLNEYLNELSRHATGEWLLFWGDDAIMHTQGWDQRIREVQGFRVLRMPTHNQHPYAIFPIVPRAWIKLFGYLSPHQLTDTWVSQVAYILNIMHDIDVEITHDRFDLTGNNNDDTYRNRPMLEGNPGDPRDFNHVTWRSRRFQDCRRIYEYMREQGHDNTWFENVMAGKQDPWARMTSEECDPNHQVAQYK